MTSSTTELTNTLDANQLSALSALKAQKSVALLGGAGSGKSHVLHRLIAAAEQMHGKYPHVVACALTNKAANALKGTTIHSLFGAKPSWEFSKRFLWEGIRNKPVLVNRLKSIKVLVIDEISLLRSNEIDAIDHVFRELADSELHASTPFGGRIVVVAGDPFQLEPYEEGNSVQVETRETAFQSRSWYLTFGPLGDGVVVVLHQNHRQSEDPKLFQMLNRIRTGCHSGDDLSLLNSSSYTVDRPPETHVRLFPTNAQVAEINREVLSKIPGDFVKLVATDSFVKKRTEPLEKRLNTVAPKEVVLKVGARVILTRKIGNVLPGTQGVIQRIFNFTRRRDYPRYQVNLELSTIDQRRNDKKILRVGAATFELHGYNREVVASREQLPILPGYAMTIHRSQGMTMTHVAIDFSAANKWRPTGLVYVALSRCRTLSGLWIKNLKDRHIRVSPRAFQLMNDIWSLKRHLPERVRGVDTRLCLGLNDDSDSLTISDYEEEEDSVVLVCEHVTNPGVVKEEPPLNVKSEKPICRKRFMPGPVVIGKRRCFSWEPKHMM